ncbi:hypothetical protein DKK71_02365 [Snodgrassella alvi]|uniref:helix-turn-helix domain-containing protein n=1 Tax=Snodgrassella alvi TaxID=1196083 RepID=UPI000D781B75|nr:hypothetical protein DKK71_02365 [Snodgrassella alvi]
MQSLLTTSEVAKYLSLNPKVVSDKARTGEIPGHKRLGRWYFFKEELDEWLKADANSATQEATHAKGNKTCLVKKQYASTKGKVGADGITRSQHQTDSEYGRLPGLTTKNKRMN